MTDQLGAGDGSVAPGSNTLVPPASGALDAAVHAELSSIVLAAQPLGAVLRRVAELAVDSIAAADDASVTLIEGGRPRTVAFCGQLAVTLDERQYQAGFGPCMDAAHGGQTIYIDTDQESGIYQDFAGAARRQGVRHVLAIGLPTLQQTSGALNLYSNRSNTASFDQAGLDAAAAFAGYAAATLFNATLYAGALEEVSQLKEAMASRAGIEQAKGIIMSRQHCSPDEAFAILVQASSTTNRKLRDIAQEIVDDARRGHG